LWAPSFGIIDGKLYVAGGSDFITELNTLYIYDIASNTWTSGANVPLAGYAAGSAVLRGKLYVFGGSNTLLSTQIYNPDQNTWSSGPNMNTATWRFYGTAVGNHSIVAVGGTNDCFSDSEISAVEQLVTIPCGPRPHPTPRPHLTPRQP
jgi:N-acetylneuraminic acid mutarotase